MFKKLEIRGRVKPSEYRIGDYLDGEIDLVFEVASEAVHEALDFYDHGQFVLRSLPKSVTILLGGEPSASLTTGVLKSWLEESDRKVTVQFGSVQTLRDSGEDLPEGTILVGFQPEILSSPELLEWLKNQASRIAAVFDHSGNDRLVEILDADHVVSAGVPSGPALLQRIGLSPNTLLVEVANVLESEGEYYASPIAHRIADLFRKAFYVALLEQGNGNPTTLRSMYADLIDYASGERPWASFGILAPAHRYAYYLSQFIKGSLIYLFKNYLLINFNIGISEKAGTIPYCLRKAFS